VAGFISEWWPESNRNGGRHQIGIPGRIASEFALERLVGKQALELEFLKGALKTAPRPKSATTSVVVGPGASASQKDAG
jgi:hypothetical protein